MSDFDIDYFGDGSGVSFFKFNDDLTDEAGLYPGVGHGDLVYVNSNDYTSRNLRQDSSNAYVVLPNLGTWFQDRSKFTFVMVTKPAHESLNTAFTFCVSNSSHSNPYYRFTLRVETSSINININSSGYGMTQNVSLDIDTLYVITVTFDNGELNLYVDGIFVGKVVIPETTVGAACYPDAAIGRIAALQSSSINYSLHETNMIRLFDRALTAIEVEILVASPVTPTPVFLRGSINENLAMSSWILRMYKLSDGTLNRETIVPNGAYEIQMASTDPFMVVALPNVTKEWQAEENVILDALRLPVDSELTPYYFKAVNSGTTDTTEPVWSNTPGQNTNDGTVVWETVERTIQPIIHSPMLPKQ